MKGEKNNFDAEMATKAKPNTGSRTNERSEIAFPYLDLDTAVAVAKHLYTRAGIGSCPLDELAAEMGQTTSGGNFRLKTGAARLFGFVEKDGQSSLKLTELGCRLVSPEGEADAKNIVASYSRRRRLLSVKCRRWVLRPHLLIRRGMLSSDQHDRLVILTVARIGLCAHEPAPRGALPPKRSI
jgi:hypothetical protein